MKAIPLKRIPMESVENQFLDYSEFLIGLLRGPKNTQRGFDADELENALSVIRKLKYVREHADRYIEIVLENAEANVIVERVREFRSARADEAVLTFIKDCTSPKEINLRDLSEEHFEYHDEQTRKKAEELRKKVKEAA